MVKSRWNIDPARMLLTGMSDGGTFCYVTGLEERIALHASGAGVSDVPSADGRDGVARRLRRLPLYLVHGALGLDVSGGGGAANAPRACRGRRRCRLPRNFDDLSHCYPGEINAACWRGCGISPSSLPGLIRQSIHQRWMRGSSPRMNAV